MDICSIILSAGKGNRMLSSTPKPLHTIAGKSMLQWVIDANKDAKVNRSIIVIPPKNKKIIGYGAPAKATTALNFFGISDHIDYIIEDNKLKHNKFIPGVKIPIKNKPDQKKINLINMKCLIIELIISLF